MKKSLLFSFLILLTGQLFSQTPSNGLIAWYKMDGNGLDSSGNNYHGTLVGPVSTTNRFNVANTALEFDGAGSYIDVPHNIWSAEATWSAWVYAYDFGLVGSTTSGKLIFFKAPNTGYNIDYNMAVGYVNSVPKTQFAFGQGSSQYVPIFGTIDLVANQWYLFTVTRTSSEIIMYINGVIDNSVSFGFSTYNQNFNLKIGVSHVNFQGFSGKMDDLMIYNRALTRQEILTIYDNYSAAIDENLSMNNRFKIIPNPSNGLCKIQFETSLRKIEELKVISQLGETVFSKNQIELSDNNELNIDLSNLNSGIYIIKIQGSNYTSSRMVSIIK